MSGRRQKSLRKDQTETIQHSTQPINAQTTRVEGKLYSGPLPHPDLMEGFKRVNPELPRLIFEMARQEQQQQHSAEEIAIEHDFILAKRGQWFALTGMVILTGAALILGLKGMEIPASLMAGTTLSGVITAFLKSKESKKTK